jgi:drug/metabolite transporter (DMT)-like permease
MPATSRSIAAPAAHGWLTPLELTLLGTVWGGSFLLMRVAAPEFGPVPLVELRLAFGALVLLPFLWPAWSQLRPVLGRLAAIGMLNSVIPFLLFAWAAQRAPAGIGAITNATTVLFTALVAFLVFGERIGHRRALGLLAGLAGVVVLAAGKTAGIDVTWAAIAGTVAAACYGVAANLIRKHLVTLPATSVAAATLSCGALLLAPFAVASWPVAAPSSMAWGAAVLLGVLCTGIAYAFFFRLIARIGPARAATVTYLVPLFGVGWAWAVLGEPLTLGMAAAGALILGGVALSQSRSSPRPVPVRTARAPCRVH